MWLLLLNFCPAMNSEMYNNPIVQRNLHTLKHDGYHIMQPGSGWLTCGVVGVGRLPEPEEIVSWLNEQFQYEPSLNFEEISGHPVALDMWEQVHDWNVEHISLATWADAYVIAPASANVIGKKLFKQTCF